MKFVKIEKTLRQVFDMNSNLSSCLEKQSKTLREQVISYILKNGIDSTIYPKIESLNLQFDGPKYFVAVARVNNSMENYTFENTLKDKNTSEENKTSNHYVNESQIATNNDDSIDSFSKIDSQIENIRLYSKNSFNYVISEYDNTITIIYNANDSSKQFRSECINEIINGLLELEIKINFGVGLVYKEKLKINSSYYEAIAALDEITSTKECNIEFFENIVKKHSNFSWYPSEEVIRYLQSIKQGDEKASINNIISVYDKVRKRNLSKLMERYVCYDIVNSFVKTINQLNINLEPLDINALASNTNIEELFEKLVELTGKVCESVCGNTQEKDREIVKEVINYVEDHFYEYDISLKRISDVFNVPSYQISRLFKEANGKGFKEYLVTLRMEKAKSLLAERYTIKEISELTGYTNPSHFIRSFKAIEGITPVHYRKLIEEGIKQRNKQG